MTQDGASLDPIRLSFEVNCPPQTAFSIWTARTSLWWPVSHSVSVAPGLAVVFEPRVGGRIFERTPAGEEFDWGEITGWEPPHRLVYLWHLRADRTDATEVDIRFVPTAPDRTQVEIEHRGWERLGSRGPARRAGNVAGWGGLLPHFVEATRDPAIHGSGA
jgi:uncharacterized protein YndB with AHSA1/START domain